MIACENESTEKNALRVSCERREGQPSVHAPGSLKRRRSTPLRRIATPKRSAFFIYGSQVKEAFVRPAISVLVLTGLVIIAGSLAPAQASQQAAVVAMVHKFIDSFNKGDTAAGVATCAKPASIIDEFPPHEWQGPAACADWSNAYNANAAANGITDGLVTLGSPWHVDVSGDRAYVVVPARYAYKQRGKPVLEPASLFTVALKKGPSGWRITAWAWSKH